MKWELGIVCWSLHVCLAKQIELLKTVACIVCVIVSTSEYVCVLIYIKQTVVLFFLIKEVANYKACFVCFFLLGVTSTAEVIKQSLIY